MSPTRYRTLQVILVWLLFATFTRSQTLSNATIKRVSARLAEGAEKSWEIGTRAQAILELDAPPFSVLTAKTQIPPSSSLLSSLSNELEPVFVIAQTTLANRGVANGNAFTPSPQPLVSGDGSAADPASIGVAVLLAKWAGRGGGDYGGAAKGQLDYLLDKVPRTRDGAISHRVSEVQLWSDFVYMVPPFLAYYGVLTRNKTVLLEAYHQISLYRSYLSDHHNHNIWKHVLLGSSGNDEGHWSTGNGWAAAGMLRVLGTIQNSQYSRSLKKQQKNLATWVKEIHAGMYLYLDNTTHMFPNYVTKPVTAERNFFDASSTALLASTVYRLALLWGDHSHIPFAERSRKALSACPPKSTSTLPSPNWTTSPNSTCASDDDSVLLHFDSNGWLTPVVNPLSYGVEGSQSPEGQAFVVEMHAAWRDWVKAGSPGVNGAGHPQAVSMVGLWVSVMVGLFLLDR